MGSAARPLGRRPPGPAHSHRPPGVVLIYPYTAGAHARLRYQLRRARVLAHSLLAWVLALPLVILRVHPLPHLSAATPITQIQPSAPSQDTAAWARHELATRLGHRPALDAWSVIVYAYYAVLNRPPDRQFTAGNRLGYGDTGTVLRATLDTGLPGRTPPCCHRLPRHRSRRNLPTRLKPR